MRVANGIYRFPTCLSQFEPIPLAGFLVVGKDGVVLIDSGLWAIERSIKPYLKSLGLSVKAVLAVIITHAHLDHTGGLSLLREINPDLEVLCSAAERKWVEDPELELQERWIERFPEPAQSLEGSLNLLGEGVSVSRTVAGGDVVDIGSKRLTIVEAAGHTSGHLAVFAEEDGVLFTGDAVQGVGIEHVAEPVHLPPLYEDVEHYSTTQERLKTLSAAQLLSSHHPLRRGQEVATFLDLSASFAKRIEDHVARIVTDFPGVSLATVGAELGHRLSTEQASRYEGALQLHALARCHLDRLTDTGVIHREGSKWRAA